MGKLLMLWRGDLTLEEAFWTSALTLGLLINVANSLLFWLLLLRDQSPAALVAGSALSVPRYIIAKVGVWRSAARYAGQQFHVDLARVVTLILMAALSAT